MNIARRDGIRRRVFFFIRTDLNENEIPFVINVGIQIRRNGL